MGVVSGIFSAATAPLVAPILALRGWKIDVTDGAKPVFHSGTNAGAQRTSGVKDWTGVFQGYGAEPPVFPGNTFAFQGQFDSVGDTKGVKCAGTAAICDRIEITWQGEEGKEIEYAVFFSGNGALEQNAAVDLSEDLEAGYDLPPTAVAMTLSGPTPVTDLRSMKLVIRAANRKYSSAAAGGWTKRTPGNIDGGCVYSAYVDEDDLTALEAALQANKVFTLNYSASEYWEITWMRILKIADLGANRESAENAFVTVTGEFNLNNGTTLGSIKSGASGTDEHWPDINTWPEALG